MKKTFVLIGLTIGLLISCSSEKMKKSDGISVPLGTNISDSVEDSDENFTDLNTRPNTVLLTGLDSHRLVTIYREKYDKDNKRKYIAGNYYHTNNYNDYRDDSNEWNNHFMPGFEAVYGYNMLNVAHYDFSSKSKNLFFKSPVLVNTLYYPAVEQDTLNNVPVNRDYYMVSVYNEDTNNDSIINYSDLRRLYFFDKFGRNQTHLIPLDYSVMSSEYDRINDFMFVFAKQDKNANGMREPDEPVHIFWFDLKAPKLAERVY